MSLYGLVKAAFGVSTTPKVSTATIGASVGLLVKGNPNRVGLTFTNNGAATVYILPFNDVSTTKGIAIGASGGSIGLNWDTDFELISRPWYAVSGAAGNVVTILENIEVPKAKAEEEIT